MKWVQLILLGWMAVGLAAAESIDPCFPANAKERTEENSAQWPWERVRRLEAERALILKKISALPQHDPRFLSDHLGYHSLFNDANPDGTLPPHQLDFHLSWAPTLEAIALAPAFNPEGTKGTIYAFPKRFKIEVFNPETQVFDVIVNWMEEDFPNPGPYPVFFSGFNRSTQHIRITVPRKTNKLPETYYALGELYLFRKGVDGEIGANMAMWNETNNIHASDSFSMPPLWDLRYLTDGITGFGFPFSDETVDSPDLMITYNEATPPQCVQLVLDLGKVQDIGRIDFWPAAAPYSLALPAFGFPKKILIELSADSTFEKTREFKIKNADRRRVRGNRISVIGEGYDARYVRITLTDLKSYKGKQILGLGEIMISNNERVWSTHCKITTTGIPPADLDQLPRLVDGYSRQRRILPQGEWIKGLALRRPLDQRLRQLETELEQARASWHKIKSRSTFWGIGLIFVGLLGGLVVQQGLRRKGVKQLKWRITRDLHDEVGSNLGSISLTAEQLQDAIWDKAMKTELGDLALMAREAGASLREVVWVIDQETIRLPALVQKLIERAEQVLGDLMLTTETSPEYPDTIVSLTFKRQLIMFFKEAVHNCARHAHASRVHLTIVTIGSFLQITISDNGCGFDSEHLAEGWGLESMKKRAKELGGEMTIKTKPNEGTTVILKVPLDLLQAPHSTYKTSN